MWSQCRIYDVDDPFTENPFFRVKAELPGRHGRTGVIRTPHGDIHTPAFVAVGTQATVKAVLPEAIKELGAQAVLANAYHLYLQPGPDIVDDAGGLGAFMNWPGPTFTDSGGFQVMSLGVGFKKVLAMDTTRVQADDIIADGKERLAHVDDDGVTFRSHLNGSTHRFTPEVSIGIQHQLGADIIFAFDELTTLVNTRGYQEASIVRTQAWAERCVIEHQRLTEERTGKPYQALFGVVQGAQHEDLRRTAARGLVSLDIDGVGELVRMASDKGRQTRPDIKLGICGEHGGDPESIWFCETVGLGYVSCSAFRVPIARLAAAQAALKARTGEKSRKAA